jgi:hypothetical protein
LPAQAFDRGACHTEVADVGDRDPRRGRGDGEDHAAAIADHVATGGGGGEELRTQRVIERSAELRDGELHDGTALFVAEADRVE